MSPCKMEHVVRSIDANAAIITSVPKVFLGVQEIL